ncbi:hypothetical protein ACQ5SO_16350 [Rhodovulum sp. DZ06]|uniref:hypothetical protein n=1 Tax=Rhodovulum sp. DZ06 TaxID=3425126 RepID=UPI003D34FB71
MSDRRDLHERVLDLLRFQRLIYPDDQALTASAAQALGIAPGLAEAAAAPGGAGFIRVLRDRVAEAEAQLAPICLRAAPAAERIDRWARAFLALLRGWVREAPVFARDFAAWSAPLDAVLRDALSPLADQLQRLADELRLGPHAGWALLAATFPWTAPVKLLTWLDDDPEPQMRAAVLRRLQRLEVERRSARAPGRTPLASS